MSTIFNNWIFNCTCSYPVFLCFLNRFLYYYHHIILKLINNIYIIFRVNFRDTNNLITLPLIQAFKMINLIYFHLFRHFIYKNNKLTIFIGQNFILVHPYIWIATGYLKSFEVWNRMKVIILWKCPTSQLSNTLCYFTYLKLQHEDALCSSYDVKAYCFLCHVSHNNPKTLSTN